MNNPHPTPNWVESGSIKLERAKELFAELQKNITEFHGMQPYKLVEEIENGTGDEIIKVHVLKKPPIRWGALFGDAIHNLRAALDLLVCQLVHLNDASILKQNAFPVYNTETDFKDGFKRQLKGVSQKNIDIIKGLKPFETGNRTVWLLHTLDIIDKHKVLLPCLSSVGSTIIDMSAGIGGMSGMSDAFKNIPPMPIALNWADPSCPVKDGEIIWRLKAELVNKGLDRKPKFIFNIALSPDLPIKKGADIGQILKEFDDEVNRIVDLFPEIK